MGGESRESCLWEEREMDGEAPLQRAFLRRGTGRKREKEENALRARKRSSDKMATALTRRMATIWGQS